MTKTRRSDDEAPPDRRPSPFAAVTHQLGLLQPGQSVFVPCPANLTLHQLQQRMSARASRQIGKGRFTTSQIPDGTPGVRVWRLK